MGDKDFVRSETFELYRDDVNRRLARLEERTDALDTEHDTDMAALATQRATEAQAARERRARRREWSWAQLATTVAAAAALGAMCLQALGR
ncbi:MAG: hypothetical protein ACRDSS_03810 [Actinocrinis sp.]